MIAWGLAVQGLAARCPVKRSCIKTAKLKSACQDDSLAGTFQLFPTDKQECAQAALFCHPER